MPTAVLTPTQDPAVSLVKRVISGGPPDDRNPKFQSCPPEVTGINADGNYTYTYDSGTFRPYVLGDEQAGVPPAQKASKAKKRVDTEYWRLLARAENPFYPTNAIWPVEDDDHMSRILAINEVDTQRRLLPVGGPPDESRLILAVVEPYFAVMEAAYSTVLSDVLAGTTHETEIFDHPAWSAVPAFIGTPPAVDEPGGVGNYPPPRIT